MGRDEFPLKLVDPDRNVKSPNIVERPVTVPSAEDVDRVLEQHGSMCATR